MQNIKEYVVAPKLSHHVIGILITGGGAAACAYMAATNTSGIHTRRTTMSAEMLNTVLWVFCAAAALMCVLFLVELILTRVRPVSKIRMTSTDFSIPMTALLRRKTVSASYTQITQVSIQLSSPNRLLRVDTTAGNAIVAERNVGTRGFDEIYATLYNARNARKI